MRSFVAPLKLTSMIQAGILSLTQELNTEHGHTVFWFGQDFLMACPALRHACKMNVLPIFEGLSCLQRKSKKLLVPRLPENLLITDRAIVSESSTIFREGMLSDSFKEEQMSWSNRRQTIFKTRLQL